MAQCVRFGWRRCSPLNWALYVTEVVLNLVLLPGMDGTGALFTPFIEILPPEVNTQTIPLIQKVGVSYQEQAKYVASEIENDSIVIAESYSGMVALELCRQFPEKVKQIVFVASFISRPSSLSRFGGHIPSAFLKLAKKPNWFLLRVLFGGKANDILTGRFIQAMSSVPLDLLKFRLKQVASLKNPTSKLSIPCTYLLARQDVLVSKNVLHVFENTFSKVVVHKLEGTHFLLQTNPEGAWDAIRASAI